MKVATAAYNLDWLNSWAQYEDKLERWTENLIGEASVEKIYFYEDMVRQKREKVRKFKEEIVAMKQRLRRVEQGESSDEE